jgi:hypothetical protein
MKAVAKMTQAELAAHVASELQQAGVELVLSGGAAVSIYTSNEYVSQDVDLIATGLSTRAQIRKAMQRMGFREGGRHYQHPESRWVVEFPGGPPHVGGEPIGPTRRLRFATGTLQVISPTDCVKDRLSAYYHWHDQQSLEQACLVAAHQRISLPEVRRWSKAEGMAEEFNKVAHLLRAMRS